MNYNKSVSDYISKANEEQMMILETLRKLIHQTVINVTEEIKWGFPVFTHKKNFAYLRLAKHHITLGFYNIDKIIDPNQLLEGDGNTLKHIKIKNMGDINQLVIAEWLKQVTS